MSETEKIAAAIGRARGNTWRIATALADAAVEIGRILAEAQAHVEREDWPQWLSESCGMTPRLAGRYIALAANPDRQICARALCGVLGLNLRDEVLLPPDEWHYTRAEDIEGRVLFMWRVKEDADKLHVFVLDGHRGSYECSDKPPRREHVADILAHRAPGGFTIANADWQILPGDEVSLEALDEMRLKYVSRGTKAEDA